MIRRATVWALAAAAREGREEAAFEALEELDPLVAGWARWRVRRLWRRALMDVDAALSTDDAAVARLAWCRASGAADPSSDADARAAFEAAGALTQPRRAWWPTWAALAAVAVAGLLVFLALQPEPALTDTPVGAALGEGVPDVVVALDRWAPASKGRKGSARVDEFRAELDAARAAVLSDALRDEAGEVAAARIRALLDAAEALAVTVPEGPEPLTRFRDAIREANAALAEAGVPWFLDGAVDVDARNVRTQVGLFVFHVDQRARMAGGAGGPVDVVRLTRVDRLNWVQPVLGYTRPDLPVAVVLRQKVEGLLVDYVGPALAEDAQMPLFDFDSRDLESPWQDELRDRAGHVARQAFREALPDRQADLAGLGDGLASRRQQFVRWRVELRRERVLLELPEELEVRDELWEVLEPLVADHELRELRRLQDDLLDGALRDTFEDAADVVARSIEGHEAQHVLDYRRGEDFPVPERLAEWTGMERKEDGTLPRGLERANYEASAYLSQVARAGAMARLEVTLLSRHLLHRGSGGTAEWYAALAIYEGLAEELGLDGSVVVRGRAPRYRVAARYLEVVDRPPAELAEAAASLWERWYGRPLPDLRRKPQPY